VKFAHISDTHIKNLKYHYEYRIIFQQLYERLSKEEVDYIIHCGDIAHTKTQISPEFVEMCSDFFRSLAEIAPTYIILGNHDGNLKNSSRQDALTPIVEALNLPTLHLLKDSGEVPLNDDFNLNVLSVFDRDNWVKPSNTDKINIALYHGSINNCKTDTNWIMANGEDTLDIFKDHDFAMLGDIHRRQFLDEEGRIWYAGSTVQQNHGETNDKGILIWDIQSKDEWEIKPIAFKNPKPFFTIELTLKGRMPRKINVPKGARLRLVSNNNLPLHTMRRAMDIAKHRFRPESISFLNRAAGIRGSVEELTDYLKTENLRDIDVQEELISEYLKDFQIDDETTERVYALNRKYNKIVEDSEEISRNINWKLKSFKWDNLFNYGDKNAIDFDKLGGIIGIFGKNFSGKSSVIDALLYTIFNTTSKNERKNLNLINQNRECGRGIVEIEVNNQLYTIERSSEKYIKRLKGEETLEAKTNLNFEVYDSITDEVTSLNGTTRNQTDANIRKRFGTVDDFLVSSMASQHGALTFIDEGSTRRKEIIAKFLDLEIFDKKFKLSKEDSIEAKVLLKKYEDKDYDTDIKEAEEELEQHRDVAERNQQRCTSLRDEGDLLQGKISDLTNQIDSIPSEYIDAALLSEDKTNKTIKVSALQDTIKEQTSLINMKSQKKQKAAAFVGSLDENELLEKQQQAIDLHDKIEKLNDEMEDIQKQEELLGSIPCGDSFPSCRFIRDAHVKVTGKHICEEDLGVALATLKDLEPDEIEKRVDQLGTIKQLILELEKEITTIRLSREKNKNIKATLEYELKEIESKIEEYNKNKETIENLERFLKEKRQHEKELENKLEQISICEEESFSLARQVGSLEQKVQSIRDQKEEHINLRKEYAAYDLLMQCMHPNGIAYDIIKKKIPVINQEIAKVLANIVEFEVFFESSGNKFDIFIKHPQYDERPIEMASGAEKTMAAMAIRLSLLSVSSLPKSDLFVLDEPGTALDEENMEGFIRILELIKVYFKNVLLISHLDSLKDCVDTQIVIEKTQGFARINQ